MTKKERAVKERAWLKMKVLSVTSSLNRKMAGDQSLTEEQKEWMAYIQNKVLIESRKAPAKWANIGAKYFQDKIGPGYRRWIDYLVNAGELAVNESYKIGGGSGFTKSYRVPSAASGVVKITFLRKQIQPPKTKPIPACNDVVLDYVGRNLRKLTVATTLLQGPDAIHDAMIHDFCWRIFFGDFDLRYGQNCRRLYHAVIEMPKEGRANLKLAASLDQLFEYDVKSCHPVLMLTLFSDPTERLLYAQLLQADIYDTIAAVMKKPVTRDEVKEAFMQAVNRSDRDVAALGKNWVYQFFQQKFPVFTEAVLNIRGDLAVFLQNVEADLMVQKLGQFCLAHDYFWIPCHDGWMTTAHFEQQIISYVHDLFHSETGFGVVISKVELNSRATVLTYPYSSGSYVHGTDTSVVPENPWLEVVEEWKRENNPIKMQEAAIKRAEARGRQKEGAKRVRSNMEASKQLAERAAEMISKRGD